MRHDISVVISSVCRLTLIRSVESIFNQDFEGKIQVLVGVDIDLEGNEAKIRQHLESIRPDFCTLTWINIGYSTSERHGGVHSCYFGGSLRTALSFLADSKYVMYLDDDDWLASSHCSLMYSSIGDNHWVASHCVFADSNTSEGICVDLIESVGVGKGVYRDLYGGFVRPSGLMINKLKLLPILSLWSQSLFEGGDGEDRLIFQAIKESSHIFLKEATIFYSMDPKDANHKMRMEYLSKMGVHYEIPAKAYSVR